LGDLAKVKEMANI